MVWGTLLHMWVRSFLVCYVTPGLVVTCKAAISAQDPCCVLWTQGSLFGALASQVLHGTAQHVERNHRRCWACMETDAPAVMSKSPVGCNRALGLFHLRCHMLQCPPAYWRDEGSSGQVGHMHALDCCWVMWLRGWLQSHPMQVGRLAKGKAACVSGISTSMACEVYGTLAHLRSQCCHGTE